MADGRVIITTYQCHSCGAEDRDRGCNPPAPLDLNCWSCRSKGTMLPASSEEAPSGQAVVQ